MNANMTNTRRVEQQSNKQGNKGKKIEAMWCGRLIDKIAICCSEKSILNIGWDNEVSIRELPPGLLFPNTGLPRTHEVVWTTSNDGKERKVKLAEGHPIACKIFINTSKDRAYPLQEEARRRTKEALRITVMEQNQQTIKEILDGIETNVQAGVPFCNESLQSMVKTVIPLIEIYDDEEGTFTIRFHDIMDNAVLRLGVGLGSRVQHSLCESR